MLECVFKICRLIGFWIQLKWTLPQVSFWNFSCNVFQNIYFTYHSGCYRKHWIIVLNLRTIINQDKTLNDAVFVTRFSTFRTVLMILCASAEFSLNIVNILLENYCKPFLILKVQFIILVFLKQIPQFSPILFKKPDVKKIENVLDICIDGMIHSFIHNMIQKIWFFQVLHKKNYSISRQRKSDEISK